MAAKFVLIIAAIAVILGNQVDAKELKVGGDEGWKVPQSPTTYSSWAASQMFSVGDTLVFEFAGGSHTVAMVEKDAYDTCDSDNVISVMTEAPVQVPLNLTGQLHFICTIGDHCSGGQKLAITVTDGEGGPTPASAPAAVAPVSEPSSAPSLSPFTIVVSASLALFFAMRF